MLRWFAASAGLVLLLAGCATGARGEAPVARSGTGQVAGELVVFAAASLTDAFAELAAELEAAHPGLDVVQNLAGSHQLAGQLLEGARADVFAAASPEPMSRTVEAGLLAGEPVVFAHNRLEIAVEAGNPHRIAGLADLADEDLVLVLAAPEVPAGRYTRALLETADVTLAPDSLEVDVRAVLGKVALGEADAGIVYRSDVVTAGDAVTGVPVPDADVVAARYPVGMLADAPNPRAAAAFVALLRSERGRSVLAEAGFATP